MMNLKEMTAKEALRAAKELSGLTIKEIASGLGVKAGVVKRYLRGEQDYTPSLAMLPRLCAVFGNTLLLDWLAAQLEEKNEDHREVRCSSATNAKDALEEVRLLVDKGENLTLEEEERICAALDETAFECERIRASLSHGQGGGCNPQKGVECPLWKFGKKPFSRTSRGQK